MVRIERRARQGNSAFKASGKAGEHRFRNRADATVVRENHPASICPETVQPLFSTRAAKLSVIFVNVIRKLQSVMIKLK